MTRKNLSTNTHTHTQQMHQIIGAFQTISPDTKSPLESFSWITDSTFTCIECKTERSQLENFLFLSLTKGNGKSLQDLCDIFLSEERLADVHCENCAKNCGHLLQRKIQRLSSTLIIHLKLFDNNGKKCRFKANVGDQIKIQSAEKVYHGELCALAGHIGPSISSGHYVAKIRAGSSTWILVNDKFVENLTATSDLDDDTYMVICNFDDTEDFTNLDDLATKFDILAAQPTNFGRGTKRYMLCWYMLGLDKFAYYQIFYV